MKDSLVLINALINFSVRNYLNINGIPSNFTILIALVETQTMGALDMLRTPPRVHIFDAIL